MTTSPQQLLDSYLKAANQADVTALLELYSDDARVFDASEKWEFAGKAAWAEMVEKWLGEMKSGGWCRAEDVQVIESEDLATISAFILYAAEISSGEKVELWNRYTAILRRSGEQWQIVHEHTSVPVTMDAEMKGITQR